MEYPLSSSYILFGKIIIIIIEKPPLLTLPILPAENNRLIVMVFCGYITDVNHKG